MFEIIPNKRLSNPGNKMTCDNEFHDSLCDPLPNTSFCMYIVGRPGSGKTSLLVNLLTNKPIKGKKCSYKKLFDHIIVCSPSIKTLGNNIFKNLPSEQTSEDFNLDFLKFIDDFTENVDPKEEKTLIILDDVASQLKRSMPCEKLLTKRQQNRRHRGLSFIILSQQYKSLPLSCRSCITHLIIFRPVNLKEFSGPAEELIPIHKKKLVEFMEFIFDKKYNFLLIDMSLQKSAKYRYFKNFDQVLIEETA